MENANLSGGCCVITACPAWNYCAHCGSKLESGWSFCPGCGLNLNAPIAYPSWPSSPWPYSPYIHWTIPPVTVTYAAGNGS